MKKKIEIVFLHLKNKHIDCLHIKYKKSETNNLFIEPKQSTINCTLIKRIKR